MEKCQECHSDFREIFQHLLDLLFPLTSQIPPKKKSISQKEKQGKERKNNNFLILKIIRHNIS